ncbi:MAG: beta-N-acetylhexosaminidase [Kiloniellales bacterium]
MADRQSAPRAVVFGCAGPSLDARERQFFRDADPLGFILFARNVDTPDRLRRLTAELRDCVGRADAPVLIDQEGGRVARLRPPHWRAAPAAARFGTLHGRDRGFAAEAVRLNARLVADELRGLGISVNCAPVLDLAVAGAHEAIGDRAFSRHPEAVASLGRALCEGMLAGGVLPVIKHIPGQGRAGVDGHVRLPVVDAPLIELRTLDFAPFRALADMPWAMTAHVLYRAVDASDPATHSRPLIDTVIRGAIGFDGVLVSDDLAMAALSGPADARAAGALAAGCDLALHCNGVLEEMRSVAAAVGRLSAPGQARVARAAARVQAPVAGFEPGAALARLNTLLAAA